MNNNNTAEMNRIKYLLLTLGLMITFPMYAFRTYDSNQPDIGLPETETLVTGLIIAAVAIPLGYLISKIEDSDKSSSELSVWGVISVLLWGGGVICLLPLLAWIAYIGQILLSWGLMIVIAIVVIGFVIHLFTRKME